MEPKTPSTKIFCVINKTTEIWVDSSQYILRYNINREKDTYNSYYYPDLEMIVHDLFDMKIKEYATSCKEHNMKSVGESIKKAENYIHEVIRPLLVGYKELTKKQLLSFKAGAAI